MLIKNSTEKEKSTLYASIDSSTESSHPKILVKTLYQLHGNEKYKQCKMNF
jgi:hypothetical protein